MKMDLLPIIKYDEAAKKLYIVYELDKTDLEKLYYAASYAVNAQDYDTALSYYEELKSKNYLIKASHRPDLAIFYCL